MVELMFMMKTEQEVILLLLFLAFLFESVSPVFAQTNIPTMRPTASPSTSETHFTTKVPEKNLEEPASSLSPDKRTSSSFPSVKDKTKKNRELSFINIPMERQSADQKKILAEGVSVEGKTTQALQPFGLDFFLPARRRILELERRVIAGLIQVPTIEQRDALSGFVGPLEMISSSVYATIPHRYVLTPGDQITVSFWAKMLDLQKISLVLDEKGEVTVPKIGKVVARGMTLDEFRHTLKAVMERVMVKDIELVVTLDRLKSIQVFITGEAFRPGSYAVSAVTTLFNALHASGGPTDLGSLRNIMLLRNQQTIRIDFYDFLIHGDSHNDLPLHAGDTIFIPPKFRSASIEGEVVRPGIYELKNGENLKGLIDLSGGIKTSAILEKVQITSISPNKERILIDVDLTRGLPIPDPVLYDGDSIIVHPILPEIANMVTLEGKVERPGVYELKEGMRLADLFSDINKPLGEVFMERADLIRLNKDRRTTTLIPIHLGKALAKDEKHNLLLARMDRLIVYSKWDVRFHPSRIVTIFGAVQKSGEYPRSEGMRLKDLLLMAGGPLPGYYEKAELARARTEGELNILKIDLQKLINGDETQNILIEDEDVFMIRKKSDFFDEPIYVTIGGEVQYPGTYALKTRTDKISDLIKNAGGLTDFGYLKGTVFTRRQEFIPSVEQRTDLAFVNQIIDMVNVLDFQRQVARNQYLLMKEGKQPLESPIGTTSIPVVSTGGNVGKAAAIAMAPSVAQSTEKMVQGSFQAMGDLPSVVSPARRLGEAELLPSERIIINMPSVISHPGSEEDLLLKAGDSLTIPSRPTTVSVIGAVFRPTLIARVKGKNVDHYINQAGGYTEDANAEKAMVLRVDGSLIPIETVEKIEEGDIIYVPAKVMSLDIVERIDKIIDVVKFTLGTAASVAVFIALIGLF